LKERMDAMNHSCGEKVRIENIEISLVSPYQGDDLWLGRQVPLEQLRAALLRLDTQDQYLYPCVIGKPGVGKTTLACTCAAELEHEVYMLQATVDKRPEDLIITPQPPEDHRFTYSASAIVSAMIRGGTVILDEGNRMPERSWAALASLLDHRRYVEADLPKVLIRAHDDFRFIVTMNEDPSTFDLPENIVSRLRPRITLEFPSWKEEETILRYHLPFVNDEVITYTLNFLQNAHKAGHNASTRDGLYIASYANKLIHQKGKTNINFIMTTAVSQMVGPDSLAFLGG